MGVFQFNNTCIAVSNYLHLLAAASSSGLAGLSFALRVRCSNPGVDTGEKGKKGTNHLSPFFELYCVSLVH
jgi:hypothetical protein